MAEHIISDKFVNYYYSNLAYNPEKLSSLYGKNSVVKYHDMEIDAFTCTGRDEIITGMKTLSLQFAVANLQTGSIDCVNYSPEDFLLSVNGELSVQGQNRSFNHVFIISQIPSKSMVFFVRSELLTLLPSADNDVNEDNQSVDVVDNSAKILSDTSVKPKIPEKREEHHVVDNRTQYHRNTSGRHENKNLGGNIEEEERVIRERTVKPIYEIIFAKNLPDDVTESDISNAFKKYGDINQIKMFPEKKYSTVSFHKADAAYMSREVYDRIMMDAPEFRINGEVIRIEAFSLNRKKPYDRSNSRYAGAKRGGRSNYKQMSTVE